MRVFLIAMSLFYATTSSALIVTFDDVVESDYGPTGPTTVTSAGFQFSVQNDILVSDSGYLLFGNFGTLDIFAVSGAAFSLQSMDLNQLGAAEYHIVGTFIGGGSIQHNPILAPGASTVLFDAGWKNLESVQFSTVSGSGFQTIDNVVVTAVPIPAAVWLFASALTGLGWVRRKQRA